MKLENKIIELYKNILEPQNERKVVLLLKYIMVDGETNLNKIKNEIGITKSFIERTIDDDSLLHQYLTEQEIKEFRIKADNILEKNRKLRKFIEVVLINKETNLKKIMDSVPISLETIRSYISNKEKMLRYLTKQEYNTLVDIIYPLVNSKKQIEKIIQAVMVDGQTNLAAIEKEQCVKRNVVKRYLANPKELEKFLSPEQLNVFISKIKKMLEAEHEQEYKKDVQLVKEIINNILDTRYLYADICAKNLFSVKKFETYLYDEEFMKKEFPKITIQQIKNKIDENHRLRLRLPRDMHIIEDKYCVMITRKDIHYLNQFDMKKVNVASYYLGTGADIKAVIKHFQMDLPEIFALLSSSKLAQILSNPYNIILKHCLNIENILCKNDLNAKKQFTIEITSFLEKNNFDMKLAMEYYNIPEPLFNRVIDEIIKLPYASLESKQKIKDILNIEVQSKTK